MVVPLGTVLGVVLVCRISTEVASRSSFHAARIPIMNVAVQTHLSTERNATTPLRARFGLPARSARARQRALFSWNSPLRAVP